MRIYVCIGLLIGFTCQAACGAIGLPPGTFRGYFFIDRWGQGVLNGTFVNQNLYGQFKALDWRPVQVEVTAIRQPSNPGPSMIQAVSKITPLGIPRLSLSLSVRLAACTYGQRATLQITLHNNTKGGIELSKRDLQLIVTTHKRGELPGGKEVKSDETFDYQHEIYLDSLSAIKKDYAPRKPTTCRASYSVPLLVDEGRIVMKNGCPVLLQMSAEGEKMVTLYDEIWTTIQPEANITTSYEIGDGWLINEYELQVMYSEKDDSVDPCSLPCEFDIAVTSGS